MQLNRNLLNNDNKYLYNGKEMQDDLFANGTKLDWLDYGARMYDSQLGRFHKQDRFAERYLDLSPYNYCAGDPVGLVDINGDTIHISDNLRKDINTFKAFQKWKKTEAGQQFFELFGEGGEFESIAVYFGNNEDIVTDKGETKSANGDTKTYAVDKNGNKTRLVSQRDNVKGGRISLKKGEHLRFEINVTSASLYKKGSQDYYKNKNGKTVYGIIPESQRRLKNNNILQKKVNTLNHEKNHLMLFHNDIRNYNYLYYNASDHHYFMNNPSSYQLKPSKFLRLNSNSK